MRSNLAKFKEDLESLMLLGNEMYLDLITPDRPLETHSDQVRSMLERVSGAFGKNYQRWFTEAAAVVRQLIPERGTEFEGYYKVDPRRKTVDHVTYSIQDWMNGLRATIDYAGKKRFEDLGVVISRFKTQREILGAAAARLESSLLDIRQILQADLFDSEIETARELLRKGFYRPAGVIAGVVIERHLEEVCRSHNVTLRKKRATIGDLNDALKANGTIEVPTWRAVQRIADLRNLAAHKSEREPTKDEMIELVDGVERLTKTLY
jgi:hypothetical protein